MIRFDQEMWICDVQSSIQGWGGGSSKPATQTSTTQTRADPWSEQQPFLKTGFQQAESNVLNKPRSYFPGSTIVPFSPETETALQATTNRALMGNPLLPAAQGGVMDTLGGGYLNQGNPAFSAMAERAISPLRNEYQNVIRPGIDSGFQMAGRGGSNMARAFTQGRGEDAYMRAVGDVGAQLAFPTYEAERGRMMQAGQMAPGLADADYTDVGQLAGVGAQRQGMDQAQLQDLINRFNFAQFEPSQRLGEYMGLVGGGYGGNTMSSTVSPSMAPSFNPVLGGLGGLAMGTGILGGLFGGQSPLFAKPW